MAPGPEGQGHREQDQLCGPELVIGIPDVFFTPRVDRLRNIWRQIAKWGDIPIHFEPWPEGKALSHADMYQYLWELCKRRARYVLLTELDFLPALWNPAWTGLAHLKREGIPGLGVEYATRDPSTMALRRSPGSPGGWWILLDSERIHTPRFAGSPDPCNQLRESYPDIELIQGRDGYPKHYGIDYPMGSHLFWSRHIDDPAERWVSGFNIGDIQKRFDRTVDRWLDRVPPYLRRLILA